MSSASPVSGTVVSVRNASNALHQQQSMHGKTPESRCPSAIVQSFLCLSSPLSDKAFEISLQDTSSAVFGVVAESIVERDGLVHLLQLKFPNDAGYQPLGKFFQSLRNASL